MTIRLNGSGHETKAETIGGLLNELGIPPDRVAVEQNSKIVKRVDVETTTISEGDVIEIVNFVGGG
jgi:thiamine biosynthesis protein ThiS